MFGVRVWASGTVGRALASQSRLHHFGKVVWSKLFSTLRCDCLDRDVIYGRFRVYLHSVHHRQARKRCTAAIVNE